MWQVYQRVNVSPYSDYVMVRHAGLRFNESDQSWFFVSREGRQKIDIETYNKVLEWSSAILSIRNNREGQLYDGSAFHIGRGYFLTAFHSFTPHDRTNTTTCNGANFYHAQSRQNFNCDEVIHCEVRADFCLLKLKERGSFLFGNRNLIKASELPAFKLANDIQQSETELYHALGNADGRGVHHSSGLGLTFVTNSANWPKYFNLFNALVAGGYSGGPLLNWKGEVVGVIVKRLTSLHRERIQGVSLNIQYVRERLLEKLPEDHELRKKL